MLTNGIINIFYIIIEIKGLDLRMEREFLPGIDFLYYVVKSMKIV